MKYFYYFFNNFSIYRKILEFGDEISKHANKTFTLFRQAGCFLQRSMAYLILFLMMILKDYLGLKITKQMYMCVGINYFSLSISLLFSFIKAVVIIITIFFVVNRLNEFYER